MDISEQRGGVIEELTMEFEVVYDLFPLLCVCVCVCVCVSM